MLTGFWGIGADFVFTSKGLFGSEAVGFGIFYFDGDGVAAWFNWSFCFVSGYACCFRRYRCAAKSKGGRGSQRERTNAGADYNWFSWFYDGGVNGEDGIKFFKTILLKSLMCPDR